MNTPQRIRTAIAAAGISQAELARRVGIAPQDLQKVLDGRVAKSRRLPDIARILDVPVAWLTTGQGPAPAWQRTPTAASRTGQVLQVVGTVSAGDGYTTTQEVREFPLSAGWALVRVEGWSAFPQVYAQQWVMIDTTRTVSPTSWTDGDRIDLDDNLVLIHTTDGKGLLKRFCRQPEAPGGYVLASINAGLASPYVPAERILTVTPVVGVVYEDPSAPRRKRYAMRHHPPMRLAEDRPMVDRNGGLASPGPGAGSMDHPEKGRAGR